MGCSVCGRPVIGRGLCKPHYEFAQRRGLLSEFKTKVESGVSKQPIAQRLLAKVEKSDSGCWEWTGAKHWNGYGIISDWPNPVKRAHRVAYEVFIGPIPEGLLVRHKCDNKGCVNPDHLEVGDKRDNALDAVERGQHKPNRRLTDAQILAIRDAGGLHATIAREFGVAQSTVTRIKNGTRWQKLTAARRASSGRAPARP